MNDPAKTLSDLVQDERLHLTPVAGERGLDGLVQSVHVVYHPDFIARVAPHTLILTMDVAPMSFQRDGVEFLRRAHENGMAGVGVGLFHSVNPLPSAMLAEADRLSLPLLTVSPDVPFQVVVGEILQRLISNDLYEMKRVLAAQDSLLDLEDADELHAMLGKLSGMLDAGFLLLDHRGHVLETYGTPFNEGAADDLVHGLWTAYLEERTNARGSGYLRSQIGPVLFQEVRVQGVLRQVLLVSGLHPQRSEAFRDAVLGFARRLLRLDYLARSQSVATLRDERRELITHLAAGRLDPQSSQERLTYLGFSDPSSLQVVLITGADSERAAADTRERAATASSPETRRAVVEHLLEQRRIAFLCGNVDVFDTPQGPAVVLQHDAREGPATTAANRSIVADAVGALSSQASSSGIRVGVGVSYPDVRPGEIPSALADALFAARQAEPDDAPSAVFCDDLGLDVRLLHSSSNADLRALRDRVRIPLRSDDPAEVDRDLRLLTTHLAGNCTLGETARRLFMHRNTLRRRLDRICGLIDLDLTNTADVSQLRLALLAGELLECRDAFAGAVLPPLD